MRRRLATLIAVAGFGFARSPERRATQVHHSVTRLVSSGREIRVEQYLSSVPGPVVILLYGSGGLQSSGVRDQQIAIALAKDGYQVYLPDYIEKALAQRASPPYGRYVATVKDLIGQILEHSTSTHEGVALIGYSLGGSVALAEASVNEAVLAVVSWSGSLPDGYVSSARLPATLVIQGGEDTVIPPWNAEQLMQLCGFRHFNCLLKLYPSEGHKFTLRSTADVQENILRFFTAIFASHRISGIK